MPKTVSAIVPIFNEEKTVAGVVDTLLGSALIDEVICVNDGSTDKSGHILQQFSDKISLIDLQENCGKGYALASGIKKAKGDIVAFFDADLLNFSENHIQALVEPILEGRYGVVFGHRVKNRFSLNLAGPFCGERVYFRNDLLPCLSRMAESRFGVEIFLNDYLIEKKTKNVRLLGLSSVYKYQKREPAIAFKEYVQEAIEIAKELAKKEVLVSGDSEIIASLSREISFQDLKRKIKAIENKRIRRMLEKYILRYIRIAKLWWEKTNV